MHHKHFQRATIVLILVFLHLLSLPGIIINEAKAETSAFEDFNIPNGSYCEAKADATYVDVETYTLEASDYAQLIENAEPISDDITEEESSFIKGFTDAIKNRYPFGSDTPEALINVAEDALIVVIGIGITVVITGIVSALAAAGAASAGTVLVAVLIAGAAVGLVFAIGTIISDFLNGDKELAGAKTFNLTREILLLLAGGGIGKAFAGKVASKAITAVRFLENKVPGFFTWLKESVNPLCHRLIIWSKDIPYKAGLLARGKKATALEVFVEKNNFTEIEIKHIYKDPNGNTCTWTASDDPELVLLSFNGKAPIKPTYNQARLAIRGGKFELVESELAMQNSEGQMVLWKKFHQTPQDDYIRIKGGDYNAANLSSEEQLAMYLEAASAEIRLNQDGTITKAFNELEGGILLADPAHEAQMTRVWNEINPNNSPVIIEEGTNFLRMTQLHGKPLGSFRYGELKLNPGAWERFVSKLNRFHKEGYVYNDFGLEGRNIFVIDGELHLLDFGISKTGNVNEIKMDLETLNEVYKFLKELGVKNIEPVVIPSNTSQTVPSHP